MLNKDEDNNYYFDYNLLYQTSYQLTVNLNNVIDVNYYPVPETSRSNFRHRPIASGVQALADVFMILGLPFDSLEAREINRLIFETIYYGALKASNDLAKERYEQLSKVPKAELKTIKKLSEMLVYYNKYIDKVKREEQTEESMSSVELEIYNNIKIEYETTKNEVKELINKYDLPMYTEEYSYMNIKEEDSDYLGSYSTFVGSPAYNGILQYDMWNVQPKKLENEFIQLKEEIKKYGLRNSLLVAIMPTATTAHILGNVECIEPITSNLYSRQTQAGTFMVANQYLQETLIKRGIWSEKIKNEILRNRGSIQNIKEIPNDIKPIYKTVWELSKKAIIDMSADRGAFVDQTQSLNIFCENPTSNVLQSIHLYGWKKGLKTGMYYLRTKPPVYAQQFTLEHKNKEPETKEPEQKEPEEDDNIPMCKRNDPTCSSCSA